MKELVERVLPKGRGNHSTAAKRSDDGRKGRGVDAFTSKETDDWEEVMKRVFQIVDREKKKGRQCYPRVSYLLHVKIETVKGVKL